MAEEMRGWVEVRSDRMGSDGWVESEEELALFAMETCYDDARGDRPLSGHP